MMPGPQHRKCSLRNDLEQKLNSALVHEFHGRFAFDFIVEELTQATSTCSYCQLMLEGLEAFSDKVGNLSTSISRVYACGQAKVDFKG